MTRAEHANKTRALRCKITKLKNKAIASGLLATKLEILAQKKEVEKELQEHKLAFYSLVTDA